MSHPGKTQDGGGEGWSISPWARGRRTGEEADLEVEEADRSKVEADGDGEEDEHQHATEYQQQPEQERGEEPPRRGTEAKYVGGRRRHHAHELTVGLSGGRWKVTRARRGRRRGRGSGRTYRRADWRADLPSRAAASARGSFTFPREPARATPPPPEIARERRAQPSSPETNPSGVSPGPGGGVVFDSWQPGSLAGQGRKHGSLQPTSARPA